MASRSAPLAILLGGLVAGTIDVGAAMLISGKDMVFILHFIAGGLLGKAAFQGGAATAFVGLLVQWALSIIIAAIYVLASLKLPILRRQWALMGLAYGVPVYFVMTYVVLPLSAMGGGWSFALEPFLKNLAAMLLFGLIVAAFARRYLPPAAP
jgi:hypothetical protein